MGINTDMIKEWSNNWPIRMRWCFGVLPWVIESRSQGVKESEVIRVRQSRFMIMSTHRQQFMVIMTDRQTEGQSDICTSWSGRLSVALKKWHIAQALSTPAAAARSSLIITSLLTLSTQSLDSAQTEQSWACKLLHISLAWVLCDLN